MNKYTLGIWCYYACWGFFCWAGVLQGVCNINFGKKKNMCNFAIGLVYDLLLYLSVCT